jgi:hypothetical protein
MTRPRSFSSPAARQRRAPWSGSKAGAVRVARSKMAGASADDAECARWAGGRRAAHARPSAAPPSRSASLTLAATPGILIFLPMASRSIDSPSPSSARCQAAVASLHLPSLASTIAVVILDHRVGRAGPRRRATGDRRPRPLPLLEERPPEAVEVGRVVGLHLERALDERPTASGARSVLVGQQVPQVVERGGIQRIALDHRAQLAFGIGQAPGLVVEADEPERGLRRLRRTPLRLFDHTEGIVVAFARPRTRRPAPARVGDCAARS